MNLVFIFLTAFAGSALGVVFADLAGQVIARRRLKKSLKKVQARLDSLFTVEDCANDCVCKNDDE